MKIFFKKKGGDHDERRYKRVAKSRCDPQALILVLLFCCLVFPSPATLSLSSSPFAFVCLFNGSVALPLRWKFKFLGLRRTHPGPIFVFHYGWG